MLALMLAMMLQSGSGVAVVQGTVRASDDGSLLAGALVEVVGGAAKARSDSAGVYALELAAPGTFHLRVSRLGYTARTLDVVVGATPLRVDVALVPQPFALPEVTIRSRSPWSPPGDDGRGVWLEPGLVTLGGTDLHANPALSSADVLGALAGASHVAAIPELMSSLHVRGGSSDQNLVLVDGIPVYNPYHGGGTLTAINPDAVSSVTLHGAVPAPQFGGALSSVVEIRTDESRPTRLTAYGAMDPSGIRQTLSAPLAWRDGTLLLSARRSLSELYPAGDGQPRSTTYSDWLGKATMRLGNGNLELLALGSSDQLAFESRVMVQSSAASDSQWPGAAPSRNQFSWQTGTQAAVWSADDGARRWQLRAWHSAFAGASTWARDSGPVQLNNDWTSVGVGALTAWRWRGAELEAGAEAERLRDGYRVSAASPSAPDTSRAGFALATQLPVMSVFVQASREWANRWTLAAGVREPIDGRAWREPEPRITVRFRASPAVAFTAGFARLRQQSQSLRNEESLVDGIVGVALPVTASHGAVPVGTSDQVALAMDARIPGDMDLRVDGYMRTLDGLVLVAPTTAQPFATGNFTIGTGVARGAGVSLSHHGERLVWSAGYTLESTTRRSASQSYNPGFGIARVLSAAAALRLGTQTTVRAALWGAWGRPSSVSVGAFDWTPTPLVHGAGTLAGSPQQLSGALGSAQLSAYWRLDAGIRREWAPAVFGSTRTVAATLGVINVFNRTNTMALTQATPGADPHPIGLAPRSLVLGLEWRY